MLWLHPRHWLRSCVTASVYCPFRALREPKGSQLAPADFRSVFKCRNIAGKRFAFNIRKPAAAAGLQGYFYQPSRIICMAEMKGDPGHPAKASSALSRVWDSWVESQCKSIGIWHLRWVCCTSTQMQVMYICDLLSNPLSVPSVDENRCVVTEYCMFRQPSVSGDYLILVTAGVCQKVM